MSSHSNAVDTKAQYFFIFDTIEKSPKLLELLAIAGDASSQKFFINTLLKKCPGVFEGLAVNPDNYFRVLLMWFGR